ncbi:hypothetical protein N7486_000800 [Penicillium sp. IBT 16267x]|nr:hypothetical protein N7486_000800 [Penicillium sp. IBT 16267x]
MDSASLLPLLEQLDDHVDDLEDVLEPLLGQSLSKTSKNLPVMDKAKLHVFVAYTLESLLFSCLRLYGVDAKQHPVYRELTRVKQYFEKIKALETEPEQRKMTLDKGAASRFVKHGLAGNEKYDLERAEREAKERARASFKAAMIAKKMAAEAQNSPLQNDGASSAAPSTAQSTADSDLDFDEETNTDAQPSGSDKEKEKVQQTKEHKTKSKNKKQRKFNKAERIDEKRERRRKKEKIRKDQKAA